MDDLDEYSIWPVYPFHSKGCVGMGTWSYNWLDILHISLSRSSGLKESLNGHWMYDELRGFSIQQDWCYPFRCNICIKSRVFYRKKHLYPETRGIFSSGFTYQHFEWLTGGLCSYRISLITAEIRSWFPQMDIFLPGDQAIVPMSISLATVRTLWITKPRCQLLWRRITILKGQFNLMNRR